MNIYCDCIEKLCSFIQQAANEREAMEIRSESCHFNSASCCTFPYKVASRSLISSSASNAPSRASEYFVEGSFYIGTTTPCTRNTSVYACPSWGVWRRWRKPFATRMSGGGDVGGESMTRRRAKWEQIRLFYGVCKRKSTHSGRRRTGSKAVKFMHFLPWWIRRKQANRSVRLIATSFQTPPAHHSFPLSLPMNNLYADGESQFRDEDK